MPSMVLNDNGDYGYPHCDSLRADKDLSMNLPSQVDFYLKKSKQTYLYHANS